MVNCTIDTPLGPTTLKIDLFDIGEPPVWRAQFGDDPEQVYFFEYGDARELPNRMELMMDLIELAVTARHD